MFSKYFFVVVLLVLPTQGSVFAQDGKFRIPLNSGRLVSTCGFNSTVCYVSGKYHSGNDYATTGDDTVLASNAGKIVFFQTMSSTDHGMGTAVIVEHHAYDTAGKPVTLYSTYNHMASLVAGLYVGEAVVKGQKLGMMGGSGYGSPTYWTKHLHFELKYSGVLGNSSGTGTYYGYMPGNAVNYGFIDPSWAISSLPPVNANDFAYWDFNGAGNFEGWSLIHIEAGSVNNGIMFDDPQAGDPQIVSPEIFVDASALRYLRFRMASNAPDQKGSIFFKTTGADSSYNADKQIDFTVLNPEFAMSGNAPFTDYSIEVGKHSKWTGKITGIRIDPAEAGANGTNKDTVGVDWVRLSPSP